MAESENGGFPRQNQSQQPGDEHRMRPEPTFIRDGYAGSGRLDGRHCLITGGDIYRGSGASWELEATLDGWASAFGWRLAFAGSRLAVGVFRFYHKAEGEDAKHGVLSTAAILISGGYFVAAALAALLAEPLSMLVFETTRAGRISCGSPH